MNPQNTKNKIIATATELFSQFGFDGTSIRNIANKANVNISAINYHFTSKEKLYYEIFDHNFTWMKNTIEKIPNLDQLTTFELIWEIFTIFSANSSKLRNCFKIFFTDSISVNVKQLQKDQQIPIGPPGENIVMNVITKEIGSDIPLETREWACHHLLIHINHLCLLFSSNFMKDRIKCRVELTDEKVKQSIQLFVEAILNQAKLHKSIIAP